MYAINQGSMSQSICYSSFVAMLYDGIVIILRMQPQAISLAMMTMRKDSYEYGAMLGNPLGHWSSATDYEWNPEPLKVWPTVEFLIHCWRMCHKTLQSNSTIQENKNLPHAWLTCSFQTCLITERVASFQHKDDFSSAISFSAGSLALAADLLKVWSYTRFFMNFHFVHTCICRAVLGKFVLQFKNQKCTL